MIFTLTDRQYNVLDSLETDAYLIGQYTSSLLNMLDIDIPVKSLNPEKWVEGNYILCVDKSGTKYWFTITDFSDSLNADVKTLTCYSGSLDVIAEDAVPISAPEAKPFSWYFDSIFYDTGVTLGINEISDLSRKLEYTSDDKSQAEMLQFVLNGFDAEARFEVEFQGSTPTSLKLNVVKHIGQEAVQTVLTDYDDSLTSLDRTGSISEIGTCLNLSGGTPDGADKAITLAGKEYVEKDAAGNIIYYSPKDHFRIYSVAARNNYFVQLPGKTSGEFDGYINRTYVSEATTQDALWQAGLTKLKSIDHAIFEYTASGKINCNLGDNIQIIAHKMKEEVMISARVIEYKFNDDDDSRNEYTFSNYVELESEMSEIDSIIAKVKKGIAAIDYVKTFYLVDEQGDNPPEGLWTETMPKTVKGWYLWTKTITFLTDGKSSFSYSATYTGNDGVSGTPGTNGKSSYTHLAYANSVDGKTDFSTTDSARSYIGMYVDQTEADSTDATKYNWTLVKGADGAPGKPGTDGKTPFSHTAYAYSADGTDGFTTVYPNLNLFTATSDKPSTSTGGSWNVAVIGVYKTPKVGQEYTFSVEVPKADHNVIVEVYRWNNAGGRVDVLTSKFINSGEKAYITVTWPDPTDSGATQIAAGLAWTNGTDTGTYSYCKAKLEIGNTATPYMPSASEVTTADWPSYMGQYTDNTAADSTDPDKYAWTLIKGATGAPGTNGADALNLVVLSSDGSIFKNTAVATTLIAHVYKGATEVVGDALTALGKINWYKDAGTTAVGIGTSFTVNAGDVDSKASYIAKLEG